MPQREALGSVTDARRVDSSECVHVVCDDVLRGLSLYDVSHERRRKATAIRHRLPRLWQIPHMPFNDDDPYLTIDESSES